MRIDIKSTIADPRVLCGDIKRRYIAEKAMEWDKSVKDIIRDSDSVDTGELLNSIGVEILENGFIGYSTSAHAKYLEFGTEAHFVPFYDESGKPVLANWARRVLKMSKEDMEAMGGMVVSSPELAFMRISLAKL